MLTLPPVHPGSASPPRKSPPPVTIVVGDYSRGLFYPRPGGRFKFVPYRRSRFRSSRIPRSSFFPSLITPYPAAADIFSLRLRGPLFFIGTMITSQPPRVEAAVAKGNLPKRISNGTRRRLVPIFAPLTIILRDDDLRYFPWKISREKQDRASPSFVRHEWTGLSIDEEHKRFVDSFAIAIFRTKESLLLSL